MGWMDFIIGMTSTILGSASVVSLVKIFERKKKPEITPEEVEEATTQLNTSEQTQVLRHRFDEFWEMHTELREEVKKMRAEMQKLQQERDHARTAYSIARAETSIVHSHVLELREQLMDDIPWPLDYPHYLLKDQK